MAIVYGIVAAIVAVLWVWLGVKIVRQWERGVLLRFGRFMGVRNPGLNRA